MNSSFFSSKIIQQTRCVPSIHAVTYSLSLSCIDVQRNRRLVGSVPLIFQQNNIAVDVDTRIVQTIEPNRI